MGPYIFNPNDARRFARETGCQTRNRRSELQFLRCPYCKADDKWTFSINLETGTFNCKRATCGAKGNMIVLARDFDFSLGQNVDEYYRQQKRFRDLRKFPTPTVKDAAIEYLEERGISEGITRKYQITVRKDDDHILIFPFYDEKGELQFLKYRKTNFDKKKDKNKEWCQAGCKPILFGMNHCNTEVSDTLVLTEGQIDSLSVAEAFDGKVNAVSVPTGAKGFTWVPYCWDFLGEYETLIVFGDHENGEITLLEEMRTRFHGTVKHVRVDDYKECKDANELLLKHGKQTVADAVSNAAIVENPRIKPVWEIKRKSVKDMEVISTGLAQLDKSIGGFFMGQLILLTGERGQGKSTLGSQFGAFAIDQNYPVMYYSGELLDWYFKDWLDRQVVGGNNINAETLDSGYTSYSVKPECYPRIEAWYADRAYLYNNEIVKDGTDENETLIETLHSAITQYGCKVIILDNLMTAIADDVSTDFYRQQTAFVRKLADMAKHYEVLIILIAHPRKRGVSEFSNDDISGSGNITNLADVVMRYALPKNDDDRRPDRILQVLKNRLNGWVDREGIALWYEESSKRIAESRTAFNWSFSWEERSGGELEPVMDDEDIPFD